MIVVMAKVPRPGFAKTRLIPALGAEGAAALCAAMTADTFARVAAAGLPWRVAVAGDLDDPWVRTVPAQVEAQADGDLGARLTHALRDGGIAVGTDCPLLSVELLAAAAASPADVFLASAEDGGYTLVKATRQAVEKGVFREVEWSTGRTLASQVARARRLGLDVLVAPGGFDVDEPAELARLLATPGLPPFTRAFLDQRVRG